MITKNDMQIEYRKPSELVEYARNPRKNDKAVDRMCSAIREFGFRIPIVAKRDGSVVDGHLRLKAARKLGLEKIPVVFADDLSEAQIKAFRLLANKSANWAEWDEDLLNFEFEELRKMEFDLELTGFDLDEINREFQKTCKDENEFEEHIPVANEKQAPISKLGDLWTLGDHKLLCGNSIDPRSYQTLLGSEIANLAITDPPYNVDYDQDDDGKKKIMNDNLGAEFNDFLKKICRNILEYTQGAIYIFMAVSEIGELKREFERAGGHWSTFIIWAKNHFSLGRSDYQRQFEPILYGWKEGFPKHWCGDRDQFDLWYEQIVGSNKLHPTMKPVLLIERMIFNSSEPHDIVLDPFGGSGSTLIACENLKRKVRMIELDPKYVDVIIKRWQKYTGQKAVNATTGLAFAESFDKTGGAE